MKDIVNEFVEKAKTADASCKFTILEYGTW